MRLRHFRGARLGRGRSAQVVYLHQYSILQLPWFLQVIAVDVQGPRSDRQLSIQGAHLPW